MTEMFDKWEELWSREIPESELDRLVNTDWLHEVKAEGDKLMRALVQLEIPERMGMHEKLKAIWNFGYGMAPSYVSARITEILEGRG